MKEPQQYRVEILTRGNCPIAGELAPGVALRVFVSKQLGSQGLSTGTATFQPGADLPYHRHPCSEAVAVLQGEASFYVEGRHYRLKPYDAVHVPAGTPHRVRNPSAAASAVLLSAFASDTPTRELVEDRFQVVDRVESAAADPEAVRRFETAEVYELAPQAFFRDLFARRFGSRGICGGFGLFHPGASLPCHVHGFDESITIVAGRAICQVAGKEYELGDCDTAGIPEARPHRFINRSAAPLAMIWIYAGDEPDRTLVDPGYCEGTLPLQNLWKADR